MWKAYKPMEMVTRVGVSLITIGFFALTVGLLGCGDNGPRTGPMGGMDDGPMAGQMMGGGELAAEFDAPPMGGSVSDEALMSVEQAGGQSMVDLPAATPPILRPEIQIASTQLLVNGTPFHIKGVNWNPIALSLIHI